MWYEEGDSLNLDLIVQNFEEDRKRYWSENERDRLFVRLVDGLAKTLLRGSEELVQPPHEPDDPSECTILCRAIVENALVEKFDRTNIPLPATAEGKSTMKARLDSAVRLNLLPKAEADDLWTIWKRGSKAAHEDPEVTQDVLGTIKLTMTVLAELYD